MQTLSFVIRIQSSLRLYKSNEYTNEYTCVISTSYQVLKMIYRNPAVNVHHQSMHTKFQLLLMFHT